MNCIVYTNNDEFSGSKELSGTTCQGVSGFFYLNYGDSICMDIDQPIILCDYFSIGGMCPTPSITPSNTPTTSVTPSITPSITPTCNQQIISFFGVVGSDRQNSLKYSYDGINWNNTTGYFETYTGVTFPAGVRSIISDGTKFVSVSNSSGTKPSIGYT